VVGASSLLFELESESGVDGSEEEESEEEESEEEEGKGEEARPDSEAASPVLVSVAWYQDATEVEEADEPEEAFGFETMAAT
jgi:hypothetical protein